MKKGKKKEKILPFSNGYYPKFKDDFWPLFTASISFFFWTEFFTIRALHLVRLMAS